MGIFFQTAGTLTMHPLVVNFLQCICAKNCESRLAADKAIAVIKWGRFLDHSVVIVAVVHQRFL